MASNPGRRDATATPLHLTSQFDKALARAYVPTFRLSIRDALNTRAKPSGIVPGLGGVHPGRPVVPNRGGFCLSWGTHQLVLMQIVAFMPHPLHLSFAVARKACVRRGLSCFRATSNGFRTV